jgi:hypothetical protein
MEMGGAQVLAVDLLNKMCTNHETTLIIVNNIYSNIILQKLDKRVTVYKINRKEGSRIRYRFKIQSVIAQNKFRMLFIA